MKTMTRLFAACIMLLLLSTAMQAQPGIQWQKCLGGSNWDVGRCARQTIDGGYIGVGYVMSNNGDVKGNHSGYFDVWVVKLDEDLNLEWQKCLGGSDADYGFDIAQTTDKGFIIAGETDSYNGDVTGNHGQSTYDYWVVKLDTAGSIQWQKCLGGSGGESANSVDQTADGGYIVSGFSWLSNDGDVTGNHGDFDYWIVKLDVLGNLEWQKSLGGSGRDNGYQIRQTPDGGYICAGFSDSNDGDVTGNHGDFDFWIVKLTATGTIEWQKSLGGSGIDDAFSIGLTYDGGYIVAGVTDSNDGDVTGNNSLPGSYGDGWVVKLNSAGVIEWQKCLGGSWDDWANSVQQTAEGGYIVACITKSQDGDVTGNHDPSGTYWDYWIVKLGATGNLEWQKCLGGSRDEETFSVSQTSDGGLLLNGVSYSGDGDITANHGNGDFWMVKLNSITGTEEKQPASVINVSPNPAVNYLQLTLPRPARIEISNPGGQIMKSFTTGTGTTRVEISDLANGNYWLKAFMEKETIVRTFIKE